MTDTRTFSFDGWVLDRASGELTREGKTQRLPQQPLRMLVELLEHPGEVVTRDRMVAVLWPKGVVDFDNSLNSVVRKLRVTLGDESDAPRYIETLPRIGYRFVGSLGAAVAPVELAAAAPPRRQLKKIFMLAGLFAVLAGVAVVFWKPRHGPIAPAPLASATEPLRTSSQRAYDFYLNGKMNRSRRDINGTALAIESFNAALREDPYFADAWAALGETYAGAGVSQNAPIGESMKQARMATLRALELDPKLSSAHAALGVIMLHYDRDYAGAEKELNAATAADPSNARAWHSLGLLRGYQGRTEEAFECIGHARAIEPTAPLYAVNYANLLYLTRRYAEAIPLLKGLLGAQPHFDQARGILIRALVESGDANAALEQLPLRFTTAQVFSDDGLALARAGRRDEALRQVDRLERRAREGYGMSYELAVLHAALGQLDQACAALRRATEDHSQTLGWMKLDPRMDPLRKEKCYADVSAALYK
ncbi:MAG: tetratricopeptide repeat protein [Pseudomonadota bacterium]